MSKETKEGIDFNDARPKSKCAKIQIAFERKDKNTPEPIEKEPLFEPIYITYDMFTFLPKLNAAEILVKTKSNEKGEKGFLRVIDYRTSVVKPVAAFAKVLDGLVPPEKEAAIRKKIVTDLPNAFKGPAAVYHAFEYVHGNKYDVLILKDPEIQGEPRDIVKAIRLTTQKDLSEYSIKKSKRSKASLYEKSITDGEKTHWLFLTITGTTAPAAIIHSTDSTNNSSTQITYQMRDSQKVFKRTVTIVSNEMLFDGSEAVDTTESQQKT